MNQVLEKAVSLARTLPENDQQYLGQKLLRLAEEKQIDAQLIKAEASGDPINIEAAFANVRELITAHKNSNA